MAWDILFIQIVICYIMSAKEDKEKEEKRNNSWKSIDGPGRKTRRVTNNNSKMATKKPSMFSQDTQTRESLMHARRIGCNHKINAYCCTTVTHSVLPASQQPIIKLKQSSKPTRQKQIKRIGKQKITKAYAAYIQGEEKQPSRLLQQSSQINVIKMQASFSQSKQESKSILQEISQDRNLIDLLEDCNIISNASRANLKDEANRFSINIKMIESDDDKSSRFEDMSVFQKSDGCIQTSIRTESDNAVSKSDIIEGSINKITSDFGAKSENSSDSKIEELIEQIEKNYQRNMENYPLVKMPELKQKDSQYLTIPENRSSFNRRQIKVQQHLNEKIKVQRTSIPKKADTSIQTQELETGAQKSEEEKILEELSQNDQSKSKDKFQGTKGHINNDNEKNSASNKQVHEHPAKQKQSQKQIKYENTPNFMYHSVEKHIFTDTPGLAQEKCEDLSFTQKPKRIIFDQLKNNENLTSSGVNILSTHLSSLHHKSSQSRVQSPLKSREGWANSLHWKHDKQNLIKSQSIAVRFGAKKKLDSESKQKMSGSRKSKIQNLQVNKCLMEARKLIKQIKER